MAKHKKSKQISNKKKQRQKNKSKEDNSNNKNVKVPSVEELIQAGDTAAASMEADKAFAFYESANDMLMSKQQDDEDHNNGTTTTTTTTTTRMEQRIYVLEKLGEAKASMGDLDSAKQDFGTAINLMMETTTTPLSLAEKNPQWQETLAGLYLYVGQVSSEQEALEAYKKGLQCLETSVELRQQECANIPAAIISSEEDDNNNDDDDDDDEMMETEDDDDNDNNKNNNNNNSPNEKHPAVALNEARQKLVSARVTVAELYLTDLCYEENAESECEAYVTKALQVVDVTDGEPMVEALQTAASLRLSQQQRQNEATTLILKTYRKIQVGCEALAKLVGLLGGTTTTGHDSSKTNNNAGGKNNKRAVELVEVDAADNLPSFEFRTQTAKLLLECGAAAANNASAKKKKDSGEEDQQEQQQKECHQAAIHVLGSLLAENDEIPEIWYLLGCAFEATKNIDNAKYYWNKGLEMLETIQKQMEEESDNNNAAMMGDDDDDNDEEAKDELDMQLQNIACQMEEIKSKLEDIEEEAEEEDDDDENATMEED